MSILLIAEHNNKEVRPFTYNAITAASLIDQDVHALVVGSSCETVAQTIAKSPLVVAEAQELPPEFEIVPLFVMRSLSEPAVPISISSSLW